MSIGVCVCVCGGGEHFVGLHTETLAVEQQGKLVMEDENLLFIYEWQSHRAC